LCGSKPDAITLTKTENNVLAQSIERNLEACGKNGQKCSFGISHHNGRISVLMNNAKYNENTKQCELEYGGWADDYSDDAVFMHTAHSI
jgi:hypothetical protein